MTAPPLHDYQLHAVAYLRERKRAALFLDMGLGKTASTLSALEPRHLPVLVIAPKRVTEDVWPEEVSIWRPDLSISVASGTPARRRAALDSGSDIVALGRDNLKDLTPEDSARFKTVVLDELSSFKGRGVRFKLMKRFITQRHFVWGLTGTPSPNGLLDLWPQVFLLDQGARLGANITAYRNRYFIPGRQLSTGVITEWIIRPGAEARIHALLEDLCLSMSTEGRVKLPPVTVNRYAVPLTPRLMDIYNEMKRNLIANLDVIGGEIHSAANAAILTSKLQQITAGFMYHDEADLRGGTWDTIHTMKVDAVADIVEASLGSPVLVFYRFKAERDALRKRFPQARVATERGVTREWNEGKVEVLLAHPASAGHGLNLQHGGHTVVWTTPTWSLEEDQQANKRVARQGQKHPVVIHYLVSPGTVDTAVLARLRDKTSVQKALLDHLELSV